MRDDAEIGLTQAQQYAAIDLGITADEIVQTGLEGFAFAGIPGFIDLVARVAENGVGVPVLPFPRQVVAALDDEYALAGMRQAGGHGAATGSGADDDDIVVVFGHAQAPSGGTEPGRRRHVGHATRGTDSG
jgi:hypothetical protein